MFRPSNHSGNHIREHEPVPNKSLMRGMIVSGLLVLAAYLLMVRTRWGQMVDIAGVFRKEYYYPCSHRL
jgi:acyl dehydratase